MLSGAFYSAEVAIGIASQSHGQSSLVHRDTQKFSSHGIFDCGAVPAFTNSLRNQVPVCIGDRYIKTGSGACRCGSVVCECTRKHGFPLFVTATAIICVCFCVFNSCGSRKILRNLNDNIAAIIHINDIVVGLRFLSGGCTKRQCSEQHCCK